MNIKSQYELFYEINGKRGQTEKRNFVRSKHTRLGHKVLPEESGCACTHAPYLRTRLRNG